MGNANERGLQILDFQRLAFLYLMLSQVDNRFLTLSQNVKLQKKCGFRSCKVPFQVTGKYQ